MYTSNKKNKKGLTLVEVLFAALILAIAVTGVLILFTQTIGIAKRVDYNYKASSLAKARMERARSVIETSGFDSLSDLAETETIIDADGISDPEGDFKRTTLVTEIDDNRTEFEVTVIYKYRETWMENNPVMFTTLFTDIK